MVGGASCGNWDEVGFVDDTFEVAGRDGDEIDGDAIELEDKLQIDLYSLLASYLFAIAGLLS